MCNVDRERVSAMNINQQTTRAFNPLSRTIATLGDHPQGRHAPLGVSVAGDSTHTRHTITHPDGVNVRAVHDNSFITIEQNAHYHLIGM